MDNQPSDRQVTISIVPEVRSCYCTIPSGSRKLMQQQTTIDLPRSRSIVCSRSLGADDSVQISRPTPCVHVPVHDQPCHLLGTAYGPGALAADGETRTYWYCCGCGYGPHDYVLHKACILCTRPCCPACTFVYHQT
ncbi:hypothetical protein EJ05DRAFT_324833 [Pseudovirgaria hyperparasitica]|uniref:Uncharacterized protein n=1 Tax=Pseudovirgaria hyperparasitica TaxID=470096 RepID=A0A6A6W7N4_9PEZI|nr:uncharacterized protein EJ05DRAFT_324833 [Pseudovirgaria hyperparasitica]KAF2758872.1 hypothetical protein EJ05DRAFT_324833 [Pseudovirgaria hyperparasitica]